ncbi:MAG: PAS domain S-box protein, partial [Candidatus Hydrogenedentota bacterium]
AMEDLSGYSSHELVGKNPSIFKSGHHDKKFYEHLWQTILSGNEFSCEFINRKKNGEIFWALTHIIPFSDKAGKPSYFLAIQESLDKFSMIPSDLKESEKIYRTLINMLPIPMAIHANGEVLYVNKAAYEMFGFQSAEDIIGRKALDFVDKDYHEIIKARMKKLLQDREPVPPANEIFVREDGSKIPVKVFAAPVIFQGKQAAMILAQDISMETELKQKLNREKFIAQDALRIKRDFIAKMSHELRTPLNSIIGFTNILKEKLKNSEYEDFVNRIRENSLHLLSLINDILELSRSENIPNQVVKEAVSLPELMVEVKNICSSLLNDEVSLISECKENILVNTDKEKVKRILINLTANAIKFTPKGKIVLRCGYTEKNLPYMEVQDTGIGISQEDTDRIFEPFEQVDKGFNRKYDGTGLGLSIVRELCSQLNIDISIQSQLKEGTIFRLIFLR